MMWSTVPWVISLPAAMMITSSASCSISDSRWLETNTVRPWAAKRPQELTHPADALRVQTVGRLVEDEHLRVADHRGGDAQPLLHAQRVPLELALRGRREADQLQHLVGALGRVAGGGADHPRWLRPVRPLWALDASSTAPTLAQLVGQVGVPHSADRGVAAGRRHQIQHHTQRGRLARSVGAEESGHPSGLHRERQVVHCPYLRVLLGQARRRQSVPRS